MSYQLRAYMFIKKELMPQKIKIILGQTVLEAELFDTPCARAIASSLPIETRPNEWGDEFYFQIPVNFPLDDSATTRIKVGDIGYWPPGQALALFFGPTPMSTGSDPVPASEINLVGRILDDPRLLMKKKGTPKIRIEQG
jgi:uncharacterized protein